MLREREVRPLGSVERGRWSLSAACRMRRVARLSFFVGNLNNHAVVEIHGPELTITADRTPHACWTLPSGGAANLQGLDDILVCHAGTDIRRDLFSLALARVTPHPPVRTRLIQPAEARPVLFSSRTSQEQAEALRPRKGYSPGPLKVKRSTRSRSFHAKRYSGILKLDKVTQCHWKRRGGAAGGVSVAASIATTGPGPAFTSKARVAVQAYGPLSAV